MRETANGIGDAHARQLIGQIMDESPGRGVEIIQRFPLDAGTFPKEVIRGRSPSGKEAGILIKYDPGVNNRAHGHRGGLQLEAHVYQQILHHTPLSTARFVAFGAEKEQTWLAVEYLEGCLRLNKTDDVSSMEKAAIWMAGFHNSTAGYGDHQRAPYLKRYDHDYYVGWARRTAQQQGIVGIPWMASTCARFAEASRDLAAATPTVIHGEYYPKNVMWCDGVVYPVDWESAAIGVDLIDLVSLTDCWPGDVVERCRQAYLRARIPSHGSHELPRLLALAECYVHMRWLSEEGDFPNSMRIERLRLLDSQLGDTRGL